MRLIPSLFLGALAMPLGAQAATFWCDRADYSTLNVTELTICETPDLRALDLHMEGLYLDLKASADAPEKRRLTDEQTQKWRLFRDTCGGDQDCLIARYAYRIHELSGQPAPLAGADIGSEDVALDAPVDEPVDDPVDDPVDGFVGAVAGFRLDAEDIAAALTPVPYSDAFSHAGAIHERRMTETSSGKSDLANPANSFDPTASTDAFLWMIAWAESRSFEVDEFFAQSLTPEQVALIASSTPEGNALTRLDFQLRILDGLALE